MSIRNTQSGWSLQDLLPEPDGPALQAYLDKLNRYVEELESARSGLSPDIPAAEYLELLEAYEGQSSIANRLSAYANLWFFADTQNSEALTFRGRIDQALAQAGNRSLFFTLWFKELPAESADRLIEASGERAYMLRNLRKFQPHTLSEAEERILNLKDVDGIEALVAKTILQRLCDLLRLASRGLDQEVAVAADVGKLPHKIGLADQ